MLKLNQNFKIKLKIQINIQNKYYFKTKSTKNFYELIIITTKHDFVTLLTIYSNKKLNHKFIIKK